MKRIFFILIAVLATLLLIYLFINRQSKENLDPSLPVSRLTPTPAKYLSDIYPTPEQTLFKQEFVPTTSELQFNELYGLIPYAQSKFMIDYDHAQFKFLVKIEGIDDKTEIEAFHAWKYKTYPLLPDNMFIVSRVEQ